MSHFSFCPCGFVLVTSISTSFGSPLRPGGGGENDLLTWWGELTPWNNYLRDLDTWPRFSAGCKCAADWGGASSPAPPCALGNAAKVTFLSHCEVWILRKGDTCRVKWTKWFHLDIPWSLFVFLFAQQLHKHHLLPRSSRILPAAADIAERS